MKPKIFIGVPTRNHAWILRKHLEGLFLLDYPKDRIFVYFLVNDCEDNTEEIIKEFQAKHKDKYLAIQYEVKNYGKEKDSRTYIRINLYSHFADLKNHVKMVFLQSDCEYWLHIDSDTIMKPDTAEKFLRHEKGYVCGYCDVSIRQDRILTNIMRSKKERFYFEDFKKKTGLIETFWAGGIACIRKDVAQKCNYHQADPRKDDNLGFCEDVRSMGLTCWADPTLELIHYMTKEQLWQS